MELPIDLLILIALAIGIGVLVSLAFVKVPADWTWTVTRLGRHSRVLPPGRHFIMPFVESVSARVDRRELTRIVPARSLPLRDGTVIEAGVSLRYRVMDPVQAVYGVANVHQALDTLAATSLARLLATRTAADLAGRRGAVEDELKRGLDQACRDWGTQVLGITVTGGT